MNIMLLVWLGLFGLIVGSFLNATAGRWGTSRQNARRSKCFDCGSELQAKNLIPLVSWLINKGRCYYCYSRVSFRYPLVELLTAILFVTAGIIASSIIQLGFIIVLFSMLIIIALIDYDQFIIPHELSVSLALLSFATLFISTFDLSTLQPDMWQVLAGPLLALFFWAIWAITRGRGMGFADGTLALSIGWLLGLWPGITAVFLSFWIGTIITVGIMLWQKHHNKTDALAMKSAVPFGPFLIVGFLIVYISNWSLFVF